jgi:hypothetical protein
MNVIVSNKYQAMLQNLDIDVIKSLHGEFEVEDLVANFKNFFFQRMILDITALKNYRDIRTLQKLSVSLDMDKVILLLDDSTEGTSTEYLSKLISIGIYNFTKNVEGIMYLYNNPNTYRDVAHIHQLDAQGSGAEIVVDNYNQQVTGTRIIGIKNVTKQSGATTLTYMMKNELKDAYSVVAIEVGKSDFRYFNDRSLISATATEVGNVVAKYMDKDVILLDVNDSKQAEELCHDVIYLIEPSIIKINKLMLINSKVFGTLKNKKVILNQSLLSPKDVLDFEYEARTKIYYNLPPLDEREKGSNALIAFLIKLGFIKLQK